jgi:hypothetical protein
MMPFNIFNTNNFPAYLLVFFSLCVSCTCKSSTVIHTVVCLFKLVWGEGGTSARLNRISGGGRNDRGIYRFTNFFGDVHYKAGN